MTCSGMTGRVPTEALAAAGQGTILWRTTTVRDPAQGLGRPCRSGRFPDHARQGRHHPEALPGCEVVGPDVRAQAGEPGTRYRVEVSDPSRSVPPESGE